MVSKPCYSNSLLLGTSSIKFFILGNKEMNFHFSVNSAYGSLTVRSLLDTREHCLEEFHFVDPYSQVCTL